MQRIATKGLVRSSMESTMGGLGVLAGAAAMLAATLASAQDAPGPEATPTAPAAPQQPEQPQFESIYEVNEDGAPMPPETWNDVAALAVNPELSADQRAAIEAGVRDWLAGVQKLVLENPDLALVVAKGLFEDIDLEQRDELAYASEIMKALSAVSNLSSDLANTGVLSNEQGQFNRRIVQEYIRARSTAASQQVMAVVSEPADQQREMQVVMARMTMTSLTDDAMRMFRSIAIRGAPHARAALEDAGLDADAYASELQAVDQASSDEERVEAMVGLMDALPTRDLFLFAEALGPKLPPVELPVLSRIGSTTTRGEGDG